MACIGDGALSGLDYHDLDKAQHRLSQTSAGLDGLEERRGGDAHRIGAADLNKGVVRRPILPQQQAHSRHAIPSEKADFGAPVFEGRLRDAAIIATHRLKSHTDLLPEGGTTDRLYVVLQGWAFRYKTTRAGGRQIVGLALPGDIANLDALMFDRPGFGVSMLSAARLAELSCDRVLTLADQYPGIARLQTLVALVENRILAQWALNLGRLSSDARLAHLLRELLERTRSGPERPDAPDRLDLPMTQEQLADTLGLTAVHVNRMMQVLRRRGLIETDGRSIEFPDLPALWGMAEFDPGYLRVEPTRRIRQAVGTHNGAHLHAA